MQEGVSYGDEHPRCLRRRDADGVGYVCPVVGEHYLSKDGGEQGWGGGYAELAGGGGG